MLETIRVFEGVSWGGFHAGFIEPLFKHPTQKDWLEESLTSMLQAGFHGFAQFVHLVPATFAGIAFEMNEADRHPIGSREQLAAYGRMRDNISEFVGVTIGALAGVALGASSELSGPLKHIPGVRGLPNSVKALFAKFVIDGFLAGTQQGIVDIISDSIMDSIVGEDWS